MSTTATEVRFNTYEGMFLFPQSATANMQAAVDHITELLNRAEAEVISMQKWDERRLAYDIKGHKRGLYFLVFFKAPTANMTTLERDCNLSETLLRAMFLRTDHLTAEQIEGADMRSQLADEIKLRSEDSTTAAASTGAARVVSKAEADNDAPKAEAEAPATEEPAENENDESTDSDT